MLRGLLVVRINDNNVCVVLCLREVFDISFLMSLFNVLLMFWVVLIKVLGDCVGVFLVSSCMVM